MYRATTRTDKGTLQGYQVMGKWEGGWRERFFNILVANHEIESLTR